MTNCIRRKEAQHKVRLTESTTESTCAVPQHPFGRDRRLTAITVLTHHPFLQHFHNYA